MISSLFFALNAEAGAIPLPLPLSIQPLPMNNLISIAPPYVTAQQITAKNIFSITFDSTNLGLDYSNSSGIGGSGRIAISPFPTQQEGIFNDPLAFPLSEYNYFSETVVSITPQDQANDVPLPASLWMLLSSFTSIILMTSRKRFFK